MAYGDGRIYWRGTKDGGSWYLYFNRHGKEIRMTAKTNNKTKAKRMLRDELNKSRTDAWVDPKDRKVTIGELVKDLATYYRGQGKERFATDTESRWELHLSDTFEHIPAPALTTSKLRAYKAARLAEKDKPALATVNRELQVIRRAYKLAAKHEPPKVARVPAFEIDHEDNARKVFLTSEQVDKICAAASAESQEWRALVELAYTLGWRRGELLGLRVSDFDMLAGTVRIATSKNGEAREAVLEGRLKLFVQPLLAGKTPEAPIFSITESSIRYGWRRICKAAGVKGVVFHDFRRTSARDKRAAGVDTSVIMAEHGWKTEAMFRRYAIVSREDKLDAQRKLAEYRAKSRTTVDHLERSGEQEQEQLQ